MSLIPMLCGAGLIAAAPAAPFVPDFAESRISLAVEEYDYEVYDVDQDGRVDLLITTRDGDRRELRFHRQRDNGAFPSDADWMLPVPADVTAYAVMDVREEPGLELVLTTRTGVFSVSTTQASLRGNLRREITLAVFPDLPRDGALKIWPFVVDLEGDGRMDLFLLQDRWWTALGMPPVPGDAGAEAFAIKQRLRATSMERGEERGQMSLGEDVSIVSGAAPRFFPGARSSAANFGGFAWLRNQQAWRPPTLFDWNLDGRLDLIEQDEGTFRIRLQQASGEYAEQILEVRVPEALGAPGDWTVNFRDLDDDKRFELALQKEDEDEDAHIFTVVPVAADGSTGEPSARVKLATMDAEFELVDVDRDGYLDLSVRTVDIPGGIQRLTNVRLDVSFQVYLGGPGATLSRRPALRLDRRYRPEELGRIQESLIFDLDGDFDGDGVADLLTVQTSGTLEITALRRSGEDLELAEAPITTFTPPAPILRARPLELSQDAVSDLLLRHDDALTIFVSRDGERP